MNILIAIPCLYGAEHTKEAIDSVVNTPATILLIDNGSEPRVKSLIEAYRHRDNVVIYSFPENVYVNPAWNMAIDFFLQNGEFTHIAIMNSDLILYRDWYKHLETALINNFIPLPIVTQDRDLLNASHESIVTEFGPPITVDGGTPGIFICLNREMVEKVGLIPEDIKVWFGDQYIYTILREIGYKTITEPCLLCYHYWSQNVQKVKGIGEIIENDKRKWELIVKKLMDDKILSNTI